MDNLPLFAFLLEGNETTYFARVLIPFYTSPVAVIPHPPQRNGMAHQGRRVSGKICHSITTGRLGDSGKMSASITTPPPANGTSHQGRFRSHWGFYSSVLAATFWWLSARL